MTEHEDELRALLHSVDNLDPDLPAALTGRARRRHTKRLVTQGACLGLAAVVVGGGAILVTKEQRTPVSVATAVPASPTASSTPVVTPSVTPQGRPVVAPDEIARRCAPQMKAYGAMRNYQPTKPWTVLQPFEHREGDVVAMQSGANNPAYCLLPAAGDEAKPVDLATFAPSLANRPRLLELCSEGHATRQPPSSTGGRSLVPAAKDLREGTIRQAALDGVGPAQVVIGLGGETFACTAFSPTWDAGGTSVSLVEKRDAVLITATSTGASNKSIVPDPAAYYFGSGRLTQGGGSIQFRVGDRLVRTVPVAADGLWNLMLRVPGEGGIKDLSWRVVDASGKVGLSGHLLG